MTYCLAIKINDGLVFASDSRTNAGLDNISTYTKMFTFNVGDRAFVILTSGNLSTTQAVYHRIEKDMESKDTVRSLNTCADIEEVATYIGELNVEYQSKAQENLSQGSTLLGSYFIVGGQIKGQDPNLLLVYPEGNFIYMSDNQPYLQIGEIKYGKPILDRMIYQNISLGDAARVALLSLDSTMRSDLTVGPPIDLVVFKRDEINLDFQEQLKLDSPFFKELSDKVFAMEISMQNPMAMVIKNKNFPKIQNGSTHKASLVLEYLNIDHDKTDGEYMISESTDNIVKLKLRKIKSDLQSHIMPSLVGMNLSDVIYLLENHGLKVKFNGYGSVVNQSIKKGESFQEGSIVKIKLS